MAKNTVEEWDSNPDGNTDVGGVSIAEGCPPGNVNNGMRMIMAQVKTYSEEVADDLAAKADTTAVTTAVAAVTTPPAHIDYFMRKTAPTGWVKANGGTIGNAASGATLRANADTVNLYTVLWNDFNNTELPIQTSGGAATTRGASAAADYAANKRLSVFDLRADFIRGADDGLGYDASLVVGLKQSDALKNHNHTIPPHSHTVPSRSRDGYGSGGSRVASTNSQDLTDTVSDPMTTSSVSLATNNQSGGSALETRPRGFVALACIKL